MAGRRSSSGNARWNKRGTGRHGGRCGTARTRRARRCCGGDRKLESRRRPAEEPRQPAHRQASRLPKHSWRCAWRPRPPSSPEPLPPRNDGRMVALKISNLTPPFFFKKKKKKKKKKNFFRVVSPHERTFKKCPRMQKNLPADRRCFFSLAGCPGSICRARASARERDRIVHGHEVKPSFWRRGQSVGRGEARILRQRRPARRHQRPDRRARISGAARAHFGEAAYAAGRCIDRVFEVGERQAHGPRVRRTRHEPASRRSRCNRRSPRGSTPRHKPRRGF